MSQLPIDPVLPELMMHLQRHRRAVLQAPPGAGKTTRVPLAMLDAQLTRQRIVMLEPRRLAARAAAERMAQTLGEPVGHTVGYRVRGEAKSSSNTRIEVVTEGILTRMIQTDPELSGIGAVIFDEFHERSLNADLGLALCLEIVGALREDLILVAMSATLNATPVATLMDAPIVTSQGQSYPVDLTWLETPIPKSMRFEAAMADLICHASEQTTGGILAFLPGEGEIRRVHALLNGRLGGDHSICPLYGAMPFKAQNAAIAPQSKGRKVVLATSIAETSLTIEDIRVVVDGGLARRSRFDPGSGMSRLVTEKVTKAEATQRAGRAGRVAKGTAFKLWTKGEDGALALFPPAEIEAADLSGLALELALWGAQPEDLAFLTPPPPGAFAESQALLREIGALDAQNRITSHGRNLAQLPLHPRLAHMIATAGAGAAPLAALLADRDPLQGAGVDLALRIEALRQPDHFARHRRGQLNHTALARIRVEAKRLARAALAPRKTDLSLAEMAALAYPDRIGVRRKGDAPRYQLSGGKGAVMDDGDPLATARLIVATDLDGNPREARIRQAVQITDSALRALFADKISWHDLCTWSKRDRRVIARQQEKLGAIVLEDRIWKNAPDAALAYAMLDGVRELGLSMAMSDAAHRFVARVHLGRKAGLKLPDLSEPALLADLETWLLAHLHKVRSAADWKRFDLLPALRTRLDWSDIQALDKLVPATFTTPLGRAIPIDYSGEHPEISLRLQEMFGQKSHPCVAGTALRVTLLSPAQRPVQTTLDLPGFWHGSYADVRKDMRAAYPRHPWPEDPTEADPTLRAKQRPR